MPTPPMPSALRRTAFVLTAAFLTTLPLSGCFWPGYSPGGQMASRDLFTYESTPDFPQNITVLDWTTNEQLVTIEVPVGQQLVIRFYADHDVKSATRPDMMRWKLMPKGTTWGELTNSLPVPDFNHRRIDVTFRTTGESVPKPTPATLPAPEPVSKPPAAPAPR